jgi:hypothetical protein
VPQPGGYHADHVPVVVNTVRVARRWIRADRFAMGVDGRGLVIVMCLCVAVFVCFFAIGRAASPGSPPREAPPPSLSVVAGAAIPISLSSAPVLEIGVATRTSRSAHRRKVPVPAENVAAPAPEATSNTPPAQAPQTEAVRAGSTATPPPTAPPAPTSSQEHSSTGAGSPAGPSKSFDSSG